jgi:uncharacterized integral membrane protein
MKRVKNISTNKDIIKNHKTDKKTFNKNTFIVLAVLLIALLLLFLTFKSIQLTNNVIEKPYSALNCSNDSVKAVWKSIFRGNSDNLTIVAAPNSNESNYSSEIFFIGGCPVYSVYQVNGQRLKALVGIDMWFLVDVNMIYAINGEFKPEKIGNITSSLSNYSESYASLLSITIMGFTENNENNSLIPRNISTIEEAKLHFESIFKISSSNWTKENNWTGEDSENINMTVYSFNESEGMKNITVFGESIDPLGEIGKAGIVFGNSSLDEYIYSEMSMLGILKTLEEKYGNWTSPINTSLKNITIEVNDSKLKVSEEFNLFSERRSGPQRVEILEDNKKIIETEVNFTDNFDWTKIKLKKQENSSDRGYIIISGLNYTKNITIDKLHNNSGYVCIKDDDSTNEYILKCPGNISNFTCRIAGNKFIVTGLKHSAVIEYIPVIPQCIPDWKCDDWSNIEKSCGYRTCADLHSCDNISSKPNESQKCPICNPNWGCTNFLPEKCPKEKKQTRTCTDTNNCKTSKGEPSLEQSCKIETNWMLIIAGILGGIIILIVIILLTKGKNSQETQNPTPAQHKQRLPPGNSLPNYPQKDNYDSSQNL